MAANPRQKLHLRRKKPPQSAAANRRQKLHLRKKKLLQHFGTVTAVKQADVEQLAAVVPRAAAQAVYDRFHGAKTE